jgi:thiosulfate dehydrogenase [quinone] large subunit
MESQCLFSVLFHGIAENPGLLQFVDTLTVIGLILVGAGLLLGLFTRVSATVGAFLILLFYVANPPFIGYLSETTSEGHYLLVNKQLIEMAVLILFVFLPKESFWSLERWILRFRQNRSKEKEDVASAAKTSVGRRELLKDLIALPFAGGFAMMAIRKKQWESSSVDMLIPGT